MLTSAAPAQIVFDLVAHPEAIQPDYFIFAIIGGGGLLLAALTRLAWLRGRPIGTTVLAVVWIGGMSYGAGIEISHVRQARDEVRTGMYQSVQGCLESFHPGKPYASKNVDADELWSVAGEHFEYGMGQVTFAWHQVEPQGGAVHADSWVSVDFMRDDDYRRNDILRLAVKQHACPKAPDILQPA
ncbi:hypothetical protein FHW96_001571 [Novosphingobium sp. SG751A]|uniref:hypothetical protein n=1 Tax=Novosphingobium sp. SG751A TaxID=2587000 RepID=UPI00155336D1|nr:hypothetical protein [Novosphingobium sp. SG751A]NOW45416.1 hypothetical protein [Novosphingobium sp. SG751A]